MKTSRPRFTTHAQKQQLQMARAIGAEADSLASVAAQMKELAAVSPPTPAATRHLDKLARRGLAARSRLDTLARKAGAVLGSDVAAPLLAALAVLVPPIPTSPPSSRHLH
jgi:hypothetical protein